MLKVFLSFLMLAFVACNNNSKDTASGTDSVSANSVNTKSYTWKDEEEKDFLAGCVDKAKIKLSDTAAFAYCKCVLNQLKQTFPNMDSAAGVLMDSARAAVYVEKCK